MDAAERIDLGVGVGDAGEVAFVGAGVVQQLFTRGLEIPQLLLQMLKQLG